ncbi:hypothetical protein G6F70_002711 [Rhizopus microsporus]|uniref:RRM domain-containing protein n=2 Tax=Rhizopus TaxID=4842 RepID=A0A367K7T9_RHIAZ|nr:hypothetical protein G6F71_008272 [Rhizopus microsporus]RCH97901.1 hypothetical protein CU097_013025 [Rhizopus azygosporus]KAG1201949.1 hypothetical protein G6F70_002711 [Rhizopus microsporus]KAG1207219.1 hypothetical protein G6F69_008217 [Rhizopus microsporus]KAG1235288.1 hypothetical protein G6F67_002864 [Rhizopus microsporus]
MSPDKKLTKREKKAQAFKKRAKKNQEITEENAIPQPDEAPEIEQPQSDRKRKAVDSQEAVAIDVPAEDKEPVKKKSKKSEDSNKHADSRYIVFVGNLPFTTTKEDLQKHFSTIEKIKSIRLLTDKATGKPKGFAFMEFENAKDMNKALAFHHTFFKKRQINVELTAGGGGSKSDARKEKLKEKNKRLAEERAKKHKKIKGKNVQQSSYKLDDDE